MKPSPSKSPPGKTRILVVDDHPLMREALARLIGRQSDLVCCGETDSAAATHDAVERFQPNLVILDLRLRHEDGLELIKSLKLRFPALLVLVLSQSDETIYAERAMRAGAHGYLMKEEAAGEVLRAIRTVLSGERYVSAKVALRLFDKALEVEPLLLNSGIESLSDRELHVFQLLGAGLGTREIGAKLNLSFKTIETHRENIKHKLGLRGAEELVRSATEWVKNQRLPRQTT